MNRKSLLDALRKQGYTGEADIAKVKAWMTGQGMDVENIQGPDETTHKLDDIWSKAASLTLDAAPEVEDEPEPEVEVKKAEPKKKGLGFRAIGGASKDDVKGDYAKKAYELKIKQGRAVYADPDLAEQIGAWCRKAAMAAKGIADYGRRSHDEDILTKASSTFVNASAGALVPPDFVAQVIYLTEKYGVAVRVANTVTMGSDERVYPRRTGVQAMSAVAENGTLTGTDDTYDNVTLTAKKYGRLALFSNELLDDSAVSIADQFTQSVSEAYAKAVDGAYFLGDGTATYNGQVGLIQALPTGAYVAQLSGSTWGAQSITDYENMIGRVENVDPSRLAWLCSRQFYYQTMVRAALAQGGVTAAETAAGMNTPGPNGADRQFIGYPVYFSQIMPTVTATTQKCLYFGDYMGGSMIGLRKEMRVDSTTDRYFDSDQFGMRAITRFAVNVHGDGRGTTYGPIVALKTS